MSNSKYLRQRNTNCIIQIQFKFNIIIENLIKFKTNILRIKYEENNISAIIDISYRNIYDNNFFIK